MAGIQLNAGPNDVQYGGETKPIAEATASIEHVLEAIYDAYNNFYAPGDPGSEISTMYQGQWYRVRVSEPIYWDWDYIASAFAKIIDTSFIPGFAPAGFVSFSVGVKNTGHESQICYLEPFNIDGTADMSVSGGKHLAPGAFDYFLISFTMGSRDVSFELRTWHHGGTGYDDTQGPFVVVVTVSEGKAKSLDVAYEVG